MLILSYVCEKDRKNGYKKLAVLQSISAAVLLCWTVVICIFDADHHTEFSYIIYATVVVILPAVIPINLVLLNILYLVCDAVLIAFTIVLHPSRYFSTILNFVIFAIVSLVACNLTPKPKFSPSSGKSSFRSFPSGTILPACIIGINWIGSAAASCGRTANRKPLCPAL